MKKLVRNFLIVLVALWGLMSVLALKGDYNAEREFWLINRGFVDMTKNPNSTPDYVADKQVKKYRAFIKRHPNSRLAGSAQFLLGNVHFLRKNYAQARQELQKVPSVYSKDKELLAQAKSAIAKTYEDQGNWNAALAVHKSVVKDYPTTQSGFLTPLRIAQYYGSIGSKNNMAAAYEEAEAFYAGIAEQNPRSALGFHALRMLAYCHLVKKEWRQTVAAMKNLMMQYPTRIALKEAVNGINVISISQTRDYDSAIEIYNQFMAKYPQHPVNGILKRMIAGLEKLKKKSASS